MKYRIEKLSNNRGYICYYRKWFSWHIIYSSKDWDYKCKNLGEVNAAIMNHHLNSQPSKFTYVEV